MKNNAICAIATPHGNSALGVIRVSGDNLKQLLCHLFTKELSDRTAVLTDIKKNNIVFDNCIAIYYLAPNSYTGEDVIEIISHGNSVIMNSILDVLYESGVSHAKPGEFTQRAYFNNKISLTDAEAISDLIAASDIHAVKAAQNSLNGKFKVDVDNILSRILSIRSEIESIINFPEDEDIPEVSISKISTQLDQIMSMLSTLIINSREGKLLNHRRVYAFVGRPNSGKSSIINRMLRENASIVSGKAGTTRDCIEYELNINNKVITLVDTAGLRESDDEVEKEGIARSLKTINKADKLFYVVDHAKGIEREDIDFLQKYNINNHVIVFNKIDIKGARPAVEASKTTEIYISALKNTGIELIKANIEDDFIRSEQSQDVYLARSRHLSHLTDAQKHLASCNNYLKQSDFDLLAEELRLAHVEMSAILGQNPTDELLQEIFTSFCIGK